MRLRKNGKVGKRNNTSVGRRKSLTMLRKGRKSSNDDSSRKRDSSKGNVKRKAINIPQNLSTFQTLYSFIRPNLLNFYKKNSNVR